MSSHYPHLKPGLTIAIPTYNRPDDLAKTLDTIIPQVLTHTDVYLDIYDNCSPVALPSFSDPRIVNHPRVRLVRNRYNEGFANFMKCVVNCETEWIWVLGDDDVPAENAVDIILSKVAAEYCYMTFKVPSANTLVTLEEDRSGEGLPGLFELFEHRIMQILCLSAAVYNMRFIREHICAGCTNIYSAAPQTLLVFLSIEKGGRWLCSKDSIVDLQEPDESQHWDRFLVYSGLPTLVFALKQESSRKLVRHAIRKIRATKPKSFLRYIRNHFDRAGDSGEIFSIMRAHYSPGLWVDAGTTFKWLLLQLKASFGHSGKPGGDPSTR